MRYRFTTPAWLRRTIMLLALVPVLTHAAVASAQGTPADGPHKHYTAKADFGLPININEQARPTIQEVQLWMKRPTGDWQRIDSAKPSQPQFQYRAPQDGEYWFTLVTVDNKGMPTPADLNRLAADTIVMVVVDTQPPSLDVQPMKMGNGDLALRCTVSDANPDYKTMRVSYRGSDQLVHLLDAYPGQPTMFRVQSPEVFLGPVRVSLKDLAGNETVREFNLQETVAKVSGAAEPVKQAGSAVPAGAGSGVVVAGGPANIGSDKGITQIGGNVPPPPPGSDKVPQPVERLTQPSAPPAAPAQLPVAINRQVINTTRASLDYRIDQVGPSGVGKVEVWVTVDQGHSWQRLCEDADRRSPAEFDLPGDGLYGLRVVVTNGNGFGGRAPQSGDQPHCWIEVDTVPPNVQLREIEPVCNGNTIDVRWFASDKNLAAEPISLFYATRREGPWLPVAKGLKNDGMYHWQFPRDAGGQFYFRVEAADKAGNVARAESVTAVVLDMTEPTASVVGVSGIHAQPTPSRGN
jgi:hypothetical protein